MRFLLANLLYGPLKNSAELDKKIPAIHRGINGKHLFGNQKLLVKTHWSYSPTLPLREDTIGVIYLLRHPIDVLASNLQYYLIRSPAFEALATEATRREAVLRWIDEYIARGGSSRAAEFDFGDWNQNVTSWTGDPLPYPRLVLRYEDLKTATTEKMFDVARFLGINATETRIAEAVARSSFTAMRTLEEEEIARRERGIFFNDTIEASVQLGGRFVRRGEVGGQETLLTPAQREAANARFGAVMARFGYAEKADQAVPTTGR